MKTSELQGAALDWAVDKAKNINTPYNSWGQRGKVPAYCTDWAQGGPIIEREYIQLTIDLGWIATRKEGPAVSEEHGPTPLIAAMRCFVASHLGDEIELPEELK